MLPYAPKLVYINTDSNVAILNKMADFIVANNYCQNNKKIAY